MTTLREGTAATQGVPTERLELWGRSARGVPRWQRDLATVDFDGASEGTPRWIAAVDGATAVFGYPNGILDLRDGIGIATAAKVIAPLRSPRGVRLDFAAPPVLAGHSVLGLAVESSIGGDPPVRRRGERYYYEVSPRGLSLWKASPSVVLVAYDPFRREVGYGLGTRSGVNVIWGKRPPRQS
jgi:hypothetical protein